MSDAEDERHRDFLVSMTSLEGGDNRFKLSQGDDDCPILDQPLADLLGEAVTVDSLLKTAREAAGDQASKDVAKTFRTAYQKSVAKNKGLRLDAPASTAQEAKVGRLATHKKFTEQMTKWDAAVHSRRAADTVSFPLVKPDLSLKNAKDGAVGFKNQTPLEMEVARLLYGSKVTADGQEGGGGNTVGLSVREMREKLNDLAKVRAHEAYQQAKLKRQNKIKSKKYRRQLRKEKKKELEAKNDDEEGKKEEADLQRIEERASLKHTKASKNLHFVAKHKDNNVKNQILAEKDRKKRELKAKEDPSSEDEDNDDDAGGNGSDDDAVTVNINGDKVVQPLVDEDAREARLLEMVQANAEKKKAEAAAAEQKNLNPDDFMQVNVKSQNFAEADTSDSEDEGVADSRNKIAEAFANDDDILRDFRKEAQDRAAAKRAKHAKPAAMPGWGNWAGSDQDMKKKRKRKAAKHRAVAFEKAAKRPREAAADGSGPGYRVIVNEGAKGKSTREHQASSVPFPFTGVADFEASIRMPVGETFVPRTSFKKLTKPKVKVAKGAIIDPVDKSELVKRGIVKFNDMQEVDVDCGMF